jgi:hypothetical protein
MTAHKPDSQRSLVCVFDDRRCAGFIMARVAKLGFEAFTADDLSLGFFQSQHSAANAILSCASFVDAEKV